MTLRFYAPVPDFRWAMFLESDTEREQSLADVSGLPCPREGDFIFHEENGPLTVVKVIWFFRAYTGSKPRCLFGESCSARPQRTLPELGIMNTPYRQPGKSYPMQKRNSARLLANGYVASGVSATSPLG